MSANLPWIASASTKESPPLQLDTECRSRHRDHGDSMAVPMLADQDRRGRGFDEIVGKSPALWTVLEQVVGSVAASGFGSTLSFARITARSTAPCVVASVVKHSESTTTKTFRESARELILQTLNASGWVVGGSKGAATKLGLKRATLIDKMKKLGIQRPAGRAGSPDANRFPQDWRPLRQAPLRKSSGQGEVPRWVSREATAKDGLSDPD
jgi:hypothetical protein